MLTTLRNSFNGFLSGYIAHSLGAVHEG